MSYKQYKYTATGQRVLVHPSILPANDGPKHVIKLRISDRDRAIVDDLASAYAAKHGGVKPSLARMVSLILRREVAIP